MEYNTTIEIKFETIQLAPPITERIKEGQPRLLLDRLPGYEALGEAGWLKIENAEGEFLSWGFIDAANNAVHLISSSKEEPFEGLIERFKTAINKRLKMKSLEGEALRCVNSTGDNLSGFTLDLYGDALVLSLETKSMEKLVRPICEEVLEPLKIGHIILKVREKRIKNKGIISQKSLVGKPLKKLINIKENGLNYHVEPMGRLDTGLFCDLRGVRREFAKDVDDRGVLNLFSYTGAFSVVAAISGARRVVSVDTSTINQQWAKANFRLNNLDPKLDKHCFVNEDVFRYLEKVTKRLESFERIVLDPPTSLQVGTGRFFLKSDLPGLIASCLNLLSPTGRLIVTDKTLKGTEEKLEQMIEKGSEIANTRCSVIKKFEPEPDFPVNRFWPKGRGVIAMLVEKI